MQQGRIEIVMGSFVLCVEGHSPNLEKPHEEFLELDLHILVQRKNLEEIAPEVVVGKRVPCQVGSENHEDIRQEFL